MMVYNHAMPEKSTAEKLGVAHEAVGEDANDNVNQEAARESASDELELTGDPKLDALLQDIRRAMKKGEGAVVVVGGITGEAAAPSVANSERASYGEEVRGRFPNVHVLARRPDGYSASALEHERQDHPHDVFVVDAPVFFDSLAQLTPSLDIALRGDDARSAWREWMEKAVVAKGEGGKSEFAELKEKFDEMRAGMTGLGHFSMALPASAAALACTAYVYAAKNPEVEWNADVVEALLSKISASADATFFLHVDDGEMSVRCGDEQIV